jgi:hypothetical protein
MAIIYYVDSENQCAAVLKTDNGASRLQHTKRGERGANTILANRHLSNESGAVDGIEGVL